MIQFFIGIVFLVVGALIVVKSEAMLSMFGRIAFFEQHLGVEGGSRLGYKIIGMVVIFLGILLMTGMYKGFMEWILSPLIYAGQQK